MLFKQADLKKIKAGEIAHTIRRWKKVQAKKGSLIKTSIGQLEILKVEKITKKAITDNIAKGAGFESRNDLIKLLERKKEGDIYKIGIRFHSADPRIKLRSKAELSKADYNAILARLQRFDKYSKLGNWTFETLEVIRNQPNTKAAVLASELQREKMWFKQNVRKLKELGLTISQDVGYTLSPRGESFCKMYLSG